MLKSRISKHIVFIAMLAIIFGTLTTVSLASAARFAGEWEGAINASGAELGIVIRIQQGEDGEWSGSADIPMQNAFGLQLNQFKTEGNAISFAFAAIPATFETLLSEDGQSLTGTFLQNGTKMPLRLARKGGEEKADPLEGYADFLRGAMQDLHVPGMAIAIVKDGQVIFSEGFGLRDVAKEQPVTPDTVFQIGSATKAFTATVFESLVEEGKLDWNKPVREYIPGYRLWDDFATDRITALDWATHRSGLPRHDLMWVFNPGLDATQTIANARYLEPSRDFRTTWQYNNLGYVTLGYLISQAAGKPWDQVVQERILDPLGMKRTSFDVDGLLSADNAALPYAFKKGNIAQVPLLSIGAARPAGAINSSVSDMVKWVQLQLNKGLVGNRQILESAGITNLHTSQIPLGVASGLPGIEHQGYGLGWFVESYRGHYHVFHGGNTPGFTSLVSFLPKDNIGIVVLTNADGSIMPSLAIYAAFDRLLGLTPTNWPQLFKQALTAAEKMQETMASETGRPNTTPSHPLEEYCGEYSHPAYGTVSIRQNGTSLEAIYYQANIALKHKHYDQFIGEADWTSTMYLPVRFETDARGDIGKVLITFDASVSPISFVRKPASQLSDPAFLKRLVGVYDFQGQQIRFELLGNVLQMKLAGQPVYNLIPERGTRFTLEFPPGFSVAFDMPADDKPAGKAIMNQQGYVFEAVRIESETPQTTAN